MFLNSLVNYGDEFLRRRTYPWSWNILAELCIELSASGVLACSRGSYGFLWCRSQERATVGDHGVLLTSPELATLVGISVIGFIYALSMLDHDFSIPSCSPICYAAWWDAKSMFYVHSKWKIIVDLEVVVSGGFCVCVLEKFSAIFFIYSCFHIGIDFEDEVRS